MKRMTTKMSTVTPKSTLTNSKSVGSGVANMGKKSKGLSMAQKTTKSAAKEAQSESYSNMPRLAMKSERRPKAESMMMGAMAGMPKISRKSAKMLPEVKVTAPGKLKRFVSKITSKRK